MIEGIKQNPSVQAAEVESNCLPIRRKVEHNKANLTGPRIPGNEGLFMIGSIAKTVSCWCATFKGIRCFDVP